MKRSLLTLFFLLSFRGFSNPFYSANGKAYLGDTDSLFLGKNKVYFHPLYNDYLGGTDKLLTGAIKLGLTQTKEVYSYDFRLSWRLLSPIIRNYQAPKNIKTGVYVDWLEAKFAWSTVYEKGFVPLKIQLGFGINHLGNHGAYSLQTKIHEVVGTSNEGVEYAYAFKGFYPSLDINFSLLKTQLDTEKVFHQFSIGHSFSPALLESYINYNLVSSLFFKEPWLSFELGLFYQHKSVFFGEGIRDFRYEIIAGFLIFKYYKPSVKYISNYLKKDPRRQIFVDLINIQIPF